MNPWTKTVYALVDEHGDVVMVDKSPYFNVNRDKVKEGLEKRKGQKLRIVECVATVVPKKGGQV